jgi:hypothetical protein
MKRCKKRLINELFSLNNFELKLFRIPKSKILKSSKNLNSIKMIENR